MKKFAINLLLFVFFAIVVLNIKPFYLLFKNRYQQVVAGAEAYYSIEKARKKSKAKKLLLGDSVGQQFFPNKSTNYPLNSLACNSGVSLAGQFILLSTYLKAGNEPDTVFLLLRPSSFKNNLNQIFTYNYFLKPFNTAEFSAYLTETVHTQLNKLPYKNFARLPYILTSNWSPSKIPIDTYYNYTFLSPISVEYLKKMIVLSKLHNFKILIVAAPLKDIFKSEVEIMHKNEIQKNGFTNEFRNYFENILFLNDSNFIDDMHLKNPEKFKMEVLKRMMGN